MSNQERETELQDSDYLLRRVPVNDPNFIRDDGTPSSLAFTPKKNDKGLSVNVKRLATYEKSILEKKSYSLYQVTVSFVRNLGAQCDCVHDPRPDNPAHALILGLNRKKSRQLARKASHCGYF